MTFSDLLRHCAASTVPGGNVSTRLQRATNAACHYCNPWTKKRRDGGIIHQRRRRGRRQNTLQKGFIRAYIREVAGSSPALPTTKSPERSGDFCCFVPSRRAQPNSLPGSCVTQRAADRPEPRCSEVRRPEHAFETIAILTAINTLPSG